MKSLAVCIVLTLAAQAAWDKPAESWTDMDARQILTDSPWAKKIGTNVTVRWQSALPVRLALPKIGIQPIAGGPHTYTIAVAGLGGEHTLADLERLRQAGELTAQLQARGRRAVQAIESRILMEDDRSPLVIFVFPEIEYIDQPIFRLPLGITPTPPKVTFRTHIGSSKLDAAFAIGAMKYRGALAL